MNGELEREAGESIPQVNAMNGTSGNFARKDKSWASVPGFFASLFKKNK